MVGKLRPCAGQIGTTITVENLFYNDKQKKGAYESKAGDEIKVWRFLEFALVLTPKKAD